MTVTIFINRKKTKFKVYISSIIKVILSIYICLYNTITQNKKSSILFIPALAYRRRFWRSPLLGV